MTTTVSHRFAWLAFLAAWVAVSVPTGSIAADDAPASSSIPQSSYNNSNKQPDPFLPPKLKGPGGTEPPPPPAEFQLQGIIWHPTKPAAVVNRKHIELNQTLMFGGHAVKAIAIDRNRVVLQIGEQKFELRLEREK